MNTPNTKKIFEFIRFVNILKHRPREGWRRSGLKNTETISGHMYAMGMMTFLLGDNTPLDRLKCLQLAIVHDLAESIIGDITPHDNVPADKKKLMEDEAMQQITSTLEDDIGKTIYTLYKEYEAKETPEAKFVKDLDRFDLLFTATEYEQRDNIPGKLEEYFKTTADKIEHPLIKALLDYLLEQRQKSCL
ncbi:HD domain-containing protein 2-like [Agrilus planipennis]|uniref:5'-deoxynucleotidase HDDC2 n=1 Tax=Agrilus planipennis TaxID=224129 RepID=A0A1W4WVD0_AGRPL|nr:HD domain-containing protein 2 [Agrilus planipennis]XP_025834954.1 HD domain-containing protein 2-like [Agrilus planipennis]